MEVQTTVRPRPQLFEPHLPLARYRFTFEAIDPIVLPPSQGTLWRGALGSQLQRLRKFEPPSDGASQILDSTIYDYVFETRPPVGASKMRRYSAVPRPFVIAAPYSQTPTKVATGDRFGFDLTLIGRANEALPAIVSSFARAGEEGLGIDRCCARLCAIENIALTDPPGSGLAEPIDGKVAPRALQSPAAAPMCRRVVVSLVTPLRLVREEQIRSVEKAGRNRSRRHVLVGPRNFTPAFLLKSLVGRISMLMSFHSNADLDESLFARLKAARQELWMHEPQLQIAEQSRWSARQGKEHDLSGLIGDFKLDMGAADCLWPYLWLGQWVHAGKGTVHGLGAYRVQPVSSTSPLA